MNFLIPNVNGLDEIPDGSLLIAKETVSNALSLIVKDTSEILENIGTSVEFGACNLFDKVRNVNSLEFILKFSKSNKLYEYVLNFKDETSSIMFHDLVSLDYIPCLLYSKEVTQQLIINNVIKQKLLRAYKDGIETSRKLNFTQKDFEDYKDAIARNYSLEDLWKFIQNS